MTTTQADQHVTDGEVLRALDQQLEPSERARVTAHLESCDQCAALLTRARRRQQRLAQLLRDTDFDTPATTLRPSDSPVIDSRVARQRRAQRIARTWQQPWLRVAAAIVLLLGVTLTITPVRALVVDWVREQWSRLVNADRSAEPATAPEAVTAPIGPRIEFTHEATEFRIEFTVAQSTGSLAARQGAGEQVIAESTSPNAELLVLPTGLRVDNRQAPGASYTLVLPSSVSTLVVQVGERTVARWSAQQLSGEVTVSIETPR